MADRKSRAERVRGLYVILDPDHTGGRPLLEVARAALRGGASMLQLRDKRSGKRGMLDTARELKGICDEHGALLIVNDHGDVAALSGADGLHVGQNDLPVRDARHILLPHQLIGTSNALLEEALVSDASEADYIAVGAMYETGTKSDTRPAGLETLRRVRERVKTPIVAIGGIKASNIAPVVQAGADAICVISAVCLAEDPEWAARELVENIQQGRA
ncbi:MAG: thiamine phosphate synthase [Chloroflexota bacterium]